MTHGNGSRVVVVGSINADTSYRVPSLPRPGQTTLADSAAASPGGKGANQAIAAAAAGASARMVGVVGADSEGSALTRALADRGVAVDGIATRRGVLSGRAVVLVDDRGENSIVVLPGANTLLDESAASEALATISRGDVLVIQNEVPSAANRAAARRAHNAGATVVWNAAPAPATRDDLVYEIDVLVVNESELVQLASLLGVERREGSGPDAVMRLLSGTLRALRRDGGASIEGVCTLGAAGAVYVSPDGSGHLRAPRVSATDTTAAGDTVVGYLAAHSARPLRERLELAGAAGALAVTREGASTSIPSLHDVEQLLASTMERTRG